MGAESDTYIKWTIEGQLDWRPRKMHRFSLHADIYGKGISVLFYAQPSGMCHHRIFRVLAIVNSNMRIYPHFRHGSLFLGCPCPVTASSSMQSTPGFFGI